MPKHVTTTFFTYYKEFQGPLRCLSEICDCMCHLYIIISSIWNRHSYHLKEVSTWREDFCSHQTRKERCKSSINKAILTLLPLPLLLSFSISSDGIMQKSLQALPSLSGSDKSCVNLWLWEQETSEIQEKLNTGKQNQNHHLVLTPGEVYSCLL